MHTLTLYHRQDCHLCEDMHRRLLALAGEFGFEIELVDIDEDPVLQNRYNEKIPVLILGEDVICCHFLDERGLQQALSNG